MYVCDFIQFVSVKVMWWANRGEGPIFMNTLYNTCNMSLVSPCLGWLQSAWQDLRKSPLDLVVNLELLVVWSSCHGQLHLEWYVLDAAKNFPIHDAQILLHQILCACLTQYVNMITLLSFRRYSAHNEIDITPNLVRVAKFSVKNLIKIKNLINESQFPWSWKPTDFLYREELRNLFYMNYYHHHHYNNHHQRRHHYHHHNSFDKRSRASTQTWHIDVHI